MIRVSAEMEGNCRQWIRRLSRLARFAFLLDAVNSSEQVGLAAHSDISSPKRLHVLIERNTPFRPHLASMLFADDSTSPQQRAPLCAGHRLRAPFRLGEMHNHASEADCCVFTRQCGDTCFGGVRSSPLLSARSGRHALDCFDGS